MSLDIIIPSLSATAVALPLAWRIARGAARWWDARIAAAAAHQKREEQITTAIASLPVMEARVQNIEKIVARELEYNGGDSLRDKMIAHLAWAEEQSENIVGRIEATERREIDHGIRLEAVEQEQRRTLGDHR